jgi:hypothetical protein
MKHPLPRSQSAVPRTLHAQLEIAKAIRTLLGPDENDDLARQRHGEIAALRRDIKALARDIPKAFEEASALARAELRAALRKYSPDQPRVPKGSPRGGEWTTNDSEGGGSLSTPAGSHNLGSEARRRYAMLETGTLTDETRGTSSNRQRNPRYSGTAVEIDPSALTGIQSIDETTKKLAQILASAVDEVGNVPGAGRYGTAVHLDFAFKVFFAGIRGIGPLDIERSFRLPADYPSNKKTVTPDVVLRNDVGDIIAIYDVKTGEGLNRKRRAELRAATGVDRSVPIIELRVCADPTDCTFAVPWWD